jgi:hypothetical protein
MVNATARKRSIQDGADIVAGLASIRETRL